MLTFSYEPTLLTVHPSASYLAYIANMQTLRYKKYHFIYIYFFFKLLFTYLFEHTLFTLHKQALMNEHKVWKQASKQH